jgi:hypothetical protein
MFGMGDSNRVNIKKSLPASQFASAFWFYLPSAVQVPGAVPTKTKSA